MSKSRQLAIVVDFHFTRQKRGTPDDEKLIEIAKAIRRIVGDVVEVDDIKCQRLDGSPPGYPANVLHSIEPNCWSWE